ncbi:MAG: PAS domain-containing protein [Chloroflexi bacterium]|nr:PAS domain-containing protein [Chloroflexota bacterium]
MKHPLVVRGAVIGFAGAIGGGAAGLALASGNALAWLVVFVALAAAAGLGVILMSGPAASLRSVAEAASSMRGSALGGRATIGSGPTATLVSNFNAMAERAEAAFATMAAEHARVEAVLEAATDAMIAVTSATEVRFLNAAALRVLAISRGTAIGHPFIESARDYELDALVKRATATGQPETSLITYGPNRIPLRAVAVPIPGGGDWAILLVLNDLTEVQRTDMVRRDFLSNVSHELRTPLASISALLETIESGAIDTAEEEAQFLSRIRQQVDRLTVLVSELLDLSRIESGVIELKPEELNLHDLVAEAAALLRTRAEGEGVTIEGPGPNGAAVEADRASLLRVVTNLLDNAIRYSPRGGAIHVSTVGEGDVVTLAVADEGEGIPEKNLPRVFERFYKADTSRATGGVGLGLAIVKHLVRAHGGSVEAASAPGKGATFTVTLPRKFVGTRR